MVPWVVNSRLRPRPAALFRYVTKYQSPQVLVALSLTNCDARNSLTFRSYEKCRVSPRTASPFQSLDPNTRNHPFTLSPFFSSSYALFYTTALSYHHCFQLLAHCFHRDGGCTPLATPSRPKMNHGMANSNSSKASLHRPRHASDYRNGLPYLRFASHPHCFLVNYIDPIPHRVGPGEHFPLATTGPRS
jgi:hypothetical protein